MLYRLEELYLCRDKPECCYRSPRLLAALILICIMVSASYASTIWKWRTQLYRTGIFLVTIGVRFSNWKVIEYGWPP
ncbi:hypothetical protein C5167_042961 [Papaver somniferum]|uniref:Uncharacterized protein n=1 Tax=Papaver somniferum TaxID=3469 RepID=A0A4Y7L6W0_PAPSO|nr:hypothetical protein C5167_042961 [Papaver somniferum]